MPTATQIIDRALHRLQALRDGASHSSSQGTLALATLNEILDTYNNKRNFIYQTQVEEFAWTGATANRTIGSAGNFNTVWPNRITFASYVDSAGNATPLTHTVDRSVWESIVDKDMAGEPPSLLFFDRAFPLGVLNIWPVPPNAWTLRLASWKQLSAIATVGTTVTLPPGYESFLVWNLAMWLWPTYPTDQTRDLVFRMAGMTEANIMRINLPPTHLMKTDLALLASDFQPEYNINLDG